MITVFLATALIGLGTLTFDLLTSKWGHESPVLRASFLQIFSFLRPSVIELLSGTGQTDRQTDRWTFRQRSSVHYVLNQWGWGITDINWR